MTQLYISGICTKFIRITDLIIFQFQLFIFHVVIDNPLEIDHRLPNGIEDLLCKIKLVSLVVTQ